LPLAIRTPNQPQPSFDFQPKPQLPTLKKEKNSAKKERI